MRVHRATSRGTSRSAGGDAGVVVAVSSEGNLTLRGVELPEGTLVRDASGVFLGRVVRVFGPVKDPYVSVRPRRSPPAPEMVGLLGKTLVVKEG